MVSVNSSGKIVEAAGLTKIFTDFWMRARARAVDGVDFEIYSGEIFGLLGPNGSGKSTIIKMILGLLHKSKGRLTVFEKLPSEVTVKKYIGFLPEESYLYRYLNARETLDYYGKLFGLDRRTRRRRIDELLDMIGLAQVAHRPIGEFSKGMTRRIGIAQALINDPQFLILDEPTSGLDPIGTRQVKDLIIELGKRGKTILLSSHLLADVEDVCDRMVMLYGGKIRAQGTVDELLADSQRTLIESDRLKDSTISRIEEVIRESEGKGIDKVHAPRQKLEHLFLNIVEQAQQEQVATSGAIHDGSTAAFLQAENAEGSDLIEALSEEREVTPAARIIKENALAAEQEQHEQLIAELMDEKASEHAPSSDSPRPGKPGKPPEAPSDVDASVIDSLIQPEDEREPS